MPGCCLLISMFLVAVFVIICTDIGKDPPEEQEKPPPASGPSNEPDDSTRGGIA